MRKDRGLTEGGKWVFGWYIESDSNGRAYIVTSATGYDEDSAIDHLQKHGKIYIHEYFKVIPETVGRNTGVRDKDEKEVYAGDLCRRNSEEPLFEVKWDDGRARFYFWHEEFGIRDISYIDTMKVISNIHQKEKEKCNG